MQKYDKSLFEVEEWKEKVYQEIKDLTKEERIEYFRKGADKLLSEHGIKLKQYQIRKPVKDGLDV
jgi:hypothetical protein